jgi:hypothetical protein
VIGPNGEGKTHFMRHDQEVGWKLGYLVSLCNLVPGGEASFDSMDSIYRIIASSIRLPPDESDGKVAGEKGIEFLLEAWLSMLRSKDQLKAQKELDAVLRGSDGTPAIENPSYRKAVYNFAKRSLGERPELYKSQLVQLIAYLRGEPIDTKSMRSEYSLTERIAGASAFRMIKALCQFVRVVGFQGLIILVDEPEQDKFPSQPRQKRRFQNRFKNLLQIINEFGQGGIPHCLLLYAITDKLSRDAGALGPAFQGRVLPFKLESFMGDEEDLVNWSSPRSYSDRIDMDDEAWMRTVGKRIGEIYGVFRGKDVDYDHHLTELIDEFNPIAGFKREFVKTWIGELDTKGI